MKIVFADAGYWIALASPGDERHVRARDVSVALGKFRTVTSELVLTEMLSVLAAPATRGVAAEVVQRNGGPEYRGGTTDWASIPRRTDVLPGTLGQELEPG